MGICTLPIYASYTDPSHRNSCAWLGPPQEDFLRAVVSTGMTYAWLRGVCVRLPVESRSDRRSYCAGTSWSELSLDKTIFVRGSTPRPNPYHLSLTCGNRKRVRSALGQAHSLVCSDLFSVCFRVYTIRFLSFVSFLYIACVLFLGKRPRRCLVGDSRSQVHVVRGPVDRLFQHHPL